MGYCNLFYELTLEEGESLAFWWVQTWFLKFKAPFYEGRKAQQRFEGFETELWPRGTDPCPIVFVSLWRCWHVAGLRGACSWYPLWTLHWRSTSSMILGASGSGLWCAQGMLGACRSPPSVNRAGAEMTEAAGMSSISFCSTFLRHNLLWHSQKPKHMMTSDTCMILNVYLYR